MRPRLAGITACTGRISHHAHLYKINNVIEESPCQVLRGLDMISNHRLLHHYHEEEREERTGKQVLRRHRLRASLLFLRIHA
jgi:hypothetical protein